MKRKPVSFEPQTNHHEVFDGAFRQVAEVIARRLPACRIEHVGSSAVAGTLTKGDVDICVCVAREHFAAADALLGEHYARNLGSPHDEWFASFETVAGSVPVGIQLCVEGGPYDHFVAWRDLLRTRPDLVRDYNRLKERFAGCGMDEYREAKAVFINDALKTEQGGRV